MKIDDEATQVLIRILKRVLKRYGHVRAVGLLDLLQETNTKPFVDWLYNGSTINLFELGRVFIESDVGLQSIWERTNSSGLTFQNDICAIDSARSKAHWIEFYGEDQFFNRPSSLKLVDEDFPDSEVNAEFDSVRLLFEDEDHFPKLCFYHSQALNMSRSDSLVSGGTYHGNV